MIKNLVISMAKKYVVKEVNDLLKDKKQEVANKIGIIQTWITRVKCILSKLENLSSRLSDGELTDDEVDDSMKDLDEIIDTFK